MPRSGAARVAFGGPVGDETVPAVELSNDKLFVRIIALGAAIQTLRAPDRLGRVSDVVLGYSSPAAYAEGSDYLGATVGRYANRIAHGRFSLDGKTYSLETNDGAHHLHGGRCGLDRAVWSIERITSVPVPEVTLTHRSADGHGGYPGELSVQATFALRRENELSIEYRARTDQPTIVNITNHSYFNLAGAGGGRDSLQQLLSIHADSYTPVDALLIPTGERRSVRGSPFDFRSPARIAARVRHGADEQIRLARGYDHNFIVRGAAGRLRPAARLEDADSGRVLEILSTAPGLQFYSGNQLDGSGIGKDGHPYRQGDGICLEPQSFPDAPNRPAFPSARLDPGEEYCNGIVLRFFTS
jgi:aldose 1-epimerase